MKKIPEAVRNELTDLTARPDHDIDFSDIPPTIEGDWAGAGRGKFYRPEQGEQSRRHGGGILAARTTQAAYV